MVAQRENVSKLFSSASLIFVGLFLQSISSLVERVIIGRVLSPASYGEVNIGFAILSFGTMIGLLGFAEGVTRYTSRFDDVDDVRGIWLSGLVITGVASAVVMVILLLNGQVFVDTLFEHPKAFHLFSLFVICIPFRVGFKIALSSIRGFENTRYMTYSEYFLYPTLRILFIVAFLAAGFGIVAAGYAYVVSIIVAFFVAHYFLNKLIDLYGEFSFHLRELARFSLPLVISAVMIQLLTRTDTLMIGIFRPSYEVGQYSAAYPLAQGMMIVYGAFGFLTLPMASRLDAKGDREEIDRIYKLSTKWIYIVTFPVFLAFVLFPSDVIRIFFGGEYAPGGAALAILSIGFFLRASNGRNRKVLSALGHTRYILFGTVTAFLLNVALNVVVIPRYGFVGAAVASAVSFTALNVLITGFLWYKFDITPFSRDGTRIYLALPVALIPPAYLLSNWVSLTIINLLPFLVIVGLLSIALVGVVGSLQPEDIVVIEYIEDSTGVQIPYVRRFVPQD